MRDTTAVLFAMNMIEDVFIVISKMKRAKYL